MEKIDTSWLSPRTHIEHWTSFRLHPPDFRHRLELSRPSAIVLLGGGYSGYVNYRSRFNINNDEDNHPFLLERISICRDLGIRIILMLSGIGNRYAGILHPDWIRLASNGQPPAQDTCGHQMDPLSPYLEEWFLPQLREALSPPYSADALWVDQDCWYFKPSYSKATIARFRKLHPETPVPLISDKTLNSTNVRPTQSNPEQLLAIQKWMTFSRSIFREWQEKIAATCHEFGALYCGNASYHPDSGPETPPPWIDFLSHDIPPFPYSGCTKASFKARGLDPLGKPFDLKIWDHNSQQAWGGYTVYPKGQNQYQCEAASIIANGGILGHWTSSHSIEQALPTLRMVQERASLLENTTSCAEIALLNTPESFYSNSNQLMWAREANTPLWGLSRALQLGGFDFSIVNQDSLWAKLSQYKLVILARQNHLTNKTRRLLENFVSNGGTLLCDVKSGIDRDGKQSLSGLLGISPVVTPVDNKFLHLEISPSALGLPSQGKGFCNIILGEAKHTLELQGATPLQCYLDSPGKFDASGWSTILTQSTIPFLTKNSFGKGTAYYLTCDLFSSYQNNLFFGLKNLILDLIDRIYPSPLVRASAQRYVEVSLRDQPSQGRKILHLVNLNISSFNNSVETQYEHSIDTGLVEVKLYNKPGKFWYVKRWKNNELETRPIKRRAEWSYYKSNNITTIQVASVETIESFVLEETDN